MDPAVVKRARFTNPEPASLLLLGHHHGVTDRNRPGGAQHGLEKLKGVGESHLRFLQHASGRSELETCGWFR